MQAKKSLGQNFLKSERALRKIVEVGELKKEEQVLEIGPGQGALTEKLLATGAKVIAVEKDDELYEFLKQKFAKEIAEEKLILIHDDILNFKPESYKLEARSYKLIANIPYNITGAIFKKFLETNNQPKKMVLLVQKEVAERIVGISPHFAKATRGKKESILSISIKAYGRPEYIETVKAGSFAPAPKVDSAILVINDISKGFFKDFSPKNGEQKFFELLKTGFASKRKKLSSNLSKLYDKNSIETAFKEMGLGENARAEELHLEDWQKLLKRLL